MRNTKLSFLVPVLFFLCVLLGAAGEARAAGTLSPVSGNNNQDQINTALASGGVVHLRPGTYVVSNKIFMPSNSTLEGEKGAIIKLIDQANWPREEHGGMIQGANSNVANVRITGFEIDMNRSHNTTSNGAETPCGRYYYTMIYFSRSSNIEVDHMYMHDNWNDILKVNYCKNVSFHDNTVRNPGHDIVYAIYCDGVKIYNNYALIYCNSAFRSYYSSNMQVYDNIIGDESSSGWIGVEVQGNPAVQLNNNTFTINGGGNSNISGPTATNSSLTAPHSPEYPTTDNNGNSILEGHSTSSTSTGGNSGSDGTSSGSGDNNGNGNDAGSGEASVNYWYPINPVSNLNPYVYISPALPVSENDINALFPYLSDAPSTATEECTDITGSAGLVPCGRHINDPNTVWNECAPCNLCSMALMGQLTVEFMVKIAAVAATVAIIFGGFLYIFAAGRNDLMAKAKSMIKYTLLGFVVVFVAWAAVDTILAAFGYIRPITGSWHMIC